ncbi:hypothetical protein [Neolewinella persica]|uniref:hypothetical protein n=1 Tax=Neolewinella persica TaxID=70998 RepID=UPI00037DBFCB|nr:hypothetical protein [Neolewinella persica]
MSKRPDVLPPMLAILNLALMAFALVLLFLLFGDSVMQSFRNRPVPMDMTAYRPGSGTGGMADEDQIKDGIHVATGLIYAEGFDIVRGTCTACHSAKLVTQNRATREGWTEMIRWMQAKQGLWDLGANEPIILSYLATNYAPEDIGRRASIDVDAIEWYVLDLEKEQ